MPDPGSADDARPWPIVEFLIRLREDEARGEVRPLREYLAAYPEHEAAIAAEYLQVLALDRQAASDSVTQTPRQFGRFLLQRELGRGGEGAVFSAFEPDLGRQVALKVLHGAPWSELDEARLLRASSMAARLDHPNLCRVLAAGREGRVPWVAMQLVEGHTLAHELDLRRQRGEPMPTAVAAGLLAGAAAGLQHAHEHQVLHRDVKPGNLILRRDGQLVLTDFGLARDAAQFEDLTLGGELRGTPAYMAPEQLEGSDLDARTDLWGLGVVLFECLTLEHPFHGTSQAAVARALTERPVWTHPQWRTLGKDARAVLAMTLATDRSARYANAAMLAADLARLRAGEPVAARAPGAATRVRAWLRREPLVGSSLAAVLLSLTLGLWLSLRSWQREHAQRAMAEARAARTRSVAESILFDMDDALVDGRGNVALRQRLVVRARDALQALYAETPGDRQLRRELALAWMRAGDVAGHPSVGNRGDLVEAARCYAAAEELARASLADDERAPLLLASVLVKRGDLARATPDEAERHYRAAIDAAPATPAGIRLAAVARAHVAQIARDAHDLAAARRDIVLAERALAELAADSPGRAEAVIDLALVRAAKATIVASEGDPEAAVDVLRDALAPLDALPADSVDAARRAQVRSTLRLQLGQCLAMCQEVEDSLAEFAAVVTTYRDRLRADPSDGGAALELARALEERGRMLVAFGRPQESRQDWREALDLAERWQQEAAAARLRQRLQVEAR